MDDEESRYGRRKQRNPRKQNGKLFASSFNKGHFSVSFSCIDSETLGEIGTFAASHIWQLSCKKHKYGTRLDQEREIGWLRLNEDVSGLLGLGLPCKTLLFILAPTGKHVAN